MDTVIHLRDPATGEICAVRRSGSLLLEHLQSELAVSTVLECDDGGHPVPRAVTLTKPDAVLRSGCTYIATRAHREQMLQQQQQLATAAVSTPAPGVKPTVTFNNHVAIREYTLPSPATPTPFAVRQPQGIAAPATGSRQSLGVKQLSFAHSTVLDTSDGTSGGGRASLPLSSSSAAVLNRQPGKPPLSATATTSATAAGAPTASSTSGSSGQPHHPAATAAAAAAGGRGKLHYEVDGEMHSATWSDVEALLSRDFDAEVDAVGADECLAANMAAIDAADKFLREQQNLAQQQHAAAQPAAAAAPTRA